MHLLENILVSSKVYKERECKFDESIVFGPINAMLRCRPSMQCLTGLVSLTAGLVQSSD